MRWLLRLLLRLAFGTRLTGLDQLRFDGPAIILPNHVSFLDAVFLYAYLPANVCFVVNTAIAARIRFILRWFSHVTIDPLNPYSLKTLVNVIRRGKPVVLFPEGRITTTGNFMKIYSGVGFVALKTGAALYPVILSGPQYSRFSRITDKVRSRWFPQVRIYFDAPVRLEAGGSGSFKLKKREISDKILTLLQNAMFKAKQHGRQPVNLFNELLAAGRQYGRGKTIAEDIGGTVTYKKALIGSYVLGRKLAPLLANERQIGVLLPNSIGHLVTLFTLFYLNKTPAILNFSFGVQNSLDCVQVAGLNTIITSRLFVEKAKLEDYLRQLAAGMRIIFLEDVRATVGLTDKLAGLLLYYSGKQAAAGGQDRVILFTSGSESKPKGVVLNHAHISANIRQLSCVIDYTARDRMLNALPMFHSLGLTAGTLLPVLEGIEVYLYPTPLHYKIIPEIVYDRNVTLLLGTPTFLGGYARSAHHYDFYSLRYVLAGGEKLRDDIRRIWQEKFGIRLFEGYGTTEASPVLALNTPLFNRAGMAGKFLPGIEWRLEPVEGIGEGGNLLVKGPNIMEGYLLPGRGFIPAGEWYKSGDIVEMDADGFVRIKSRLKRFAKVSGEMVSLDAVERAAEQCFGTDRNAAVSVPDKKRGEKILLYTVNPAVTKNMLREHFNRTGQSMLALPAEVVTVDRLPLLGSGKVDYVALRASALKELENNE